MLHHHHSNRLSLPHRSSRLSTRQTRKPINYYSESVGFHWGTPENDDVGGKSVFGAGGTGGSGGSGGSGSGAAGSGSGGTGSDLSHIHTYGGVGGVGSVGGHDFDPLSTYTNFQQNHNNGKHHHTGDERKNASTKTPQIIIYSRWKREKGQFKGAHFYSDIWRRVEAKYAEIGDRRLEGDEPADFATAAAMLEHAERRKARSTKKTSESGNKKNTNTTTTTQTTTANTTQTTKNTHTNINNTKTIDSSNNSNKNNTSKLKNEKIENTDTKDEMMEEQKAEISKAT